MEHEEIKRRTKRSIVGLLISIPWALLIVSRAEPSVWMGLLFAAIIVVPQALIWSRKLFGPARTPEGRGEAHS